MSTTTDDRQLLALLLSRVAADLDRLGYPRSGVIRQGARALLDLPDPASGHVDADACVGCGAHIEQPATGRRRKWCSDSCRDRVRRG